MKLEPFQYQKDYSYTKGWDAFAMDYINLLQKDTVYELTKKLMYTIVDKHLQLEQNMKVLDIGCGTGNDFPFFLSKGCIIDGIDYSEGMLNKAYEKYTPQIEANQLRLFYSDLNELSHTSFEANSFDLIYAITGALAYIDKDSLHHIFKKLNTFLKPNGKIITAHFSRFCLAESFYYLSRLKPKKAFVRVRKQLDVPIKENYYTMHLRTSKEVTQLLEPDFNIEALYPLLLCTPPYQTRYAPSKEKLAAHYQKELKWLNSPKLANFADQFVVVFSKK